MYFKFENGYETFKNLFGKRETNNGKAIRQNGILLSFLKHEFKRKRYNSLRISSMTNLYEFVVYKLIPADNNIYLNLPNRVIRAYSPEYHTDDKQGLCEDYDAKSIRYVRNDTGKVYKMKAGKFMRHLLMSNPETADMCEQVINYVCETFASEWAAYAASENPESYELVVDDDFDKIYNSDYLSGNFHSCMTDENFHTFYKDAVNASAASLWKDDMIVARCVIFNDVKVEGKDETLRLAERQYSSEGNDDLKRVLINRLIAGNFIDGYKKIGAGCHDSRAFVYNDGTSMEDLILSVNCYLDFEEPLSYQDSFKWYDKGNGIAWNVDSMNYDFELDTTGGLIGGEWDDYHEEYCEETVEVFVWDSYSETYTSYNCNVNRLHDFTEIDGYYYDCYDYCRWYDENYPCNKVEYCEDMDDYLPKDQYAAIFSEWKEENWEYDEFNEEYAPEVIEAYVWNSQRCTYEVMNVSETYADNYFYYVDGEYYSEVSKSGMPYETAVLKTAI